MSQTGWITGVHGVLAALESGRPVDAVWVQQGRRDRRITAVVDAARARGVPVRTVPRGRLDELAAGGAHSGCAARTAPVAFRAFDELVRPPDAPSRLLVLDHLLDPHNVGAVVRSAAAFGVDGVVLAGPSAPPLDGAVERAAAGQLGRLPLARVNVAADVLRMLRDAGYWTFGADMTGSPVGEVTVPARWVLCLGAEERGLRAKTRSAVDEFVAVPMAPGVESLNVSVTAGVLLYALTLGEQAGGSGT